MKIRDIYLGKSIPVVSLVTALLCLIVTGISMIVPSIADKFIFMFPVTYPWQIITYLFQHYTTGDMIPGGLGGIPDALFSMVHLVFNLLLVLPFGVLVEKVLGTKRFLLLSFVAWQIDIGCIFFASFAAVTMYGQDSVDIAAFGASALAFAFMPVGLYIIILLGMNYGFGSLFKQVSFYLMIPVALITMFMAVSPLFGGITTAGTSFLNLIALLSGILFAVLFRGRIKYYLNTHKPASEPDVIKE